MDSLFTHIFPAPPGDLLLGDWQGELVLCDWLLASNGHRSDSRVPHLLGASLQEQATPLLAETAAQLAAFFTGKRCGFDLPLRLVGTSFQVKVWQALREIPCGETRSCPRHRQCERYPRGGGCHPQQSAVGGRPLSSRHR